jgi:hypothetical protein
VRAFSTETRSRTSWPYQAGRRPARGRSSGRIYGRLRPAGDANRIGRGERRMTARAPARRHQRIHERSAFPGNCRVRPVVAAAAPRIRRTAARVNGVALADVQRAESPACASCPPMAVRNSSEIFGRRCGAAIRRAGPSAHWRGPSPITCSALERGPGLAVVSSGLLRSRRRADGHAPSAPSRAELGRRPKSRFRRRARIRRSMETSSSWTS